MIKDKNLREELTTKWFTELRDKFCAKFQELENYYSEKNNLTPAMFQREKWNREGGGGGEMSVMRGNLFEKIGVNISTVSGDLSEQFRAQIPGAIENPNFFATGISIVSHMSSPLIPAAHFNTRYIHTSKDWFGGGGDLTPMYPDDADTEAFHSAFRNACDKHDESYYEKFKKYCDEYFYLKHRAEPRGVGGIFYDYLNTGDFDKDFSYTKDVGLAFLDVYPSIISKKMDLTWTKEERDYQLKRRGRYVEFNLLYDRGTTFGLMTGGNVEAILMSLPPLVTW